jgi:pilus assembly protein CpaB
MKGKAFIPLVLGLVVGLLAVKLVVDTVRESQAGQKSETSKLVRAKMDIGAYVEIRPEMVEEVEVKDTSVAPKEQLVRKEDLFKKDATPSGDWRVTAKAIPAGSFILQNMLAPKGAKAGMVARIKPGQRAVSVKIDEVTAAGYQIKPGDLVDVMVVMEVRGTGRRKETIAEVLLQRIEVAAIGQAIDDTTPAGGTTQRPRPAKSATLLVDEADAPKLHLAASRGRIALALRGDDELLSDKRISASSSKLLAAMGLEEDESGVPVVQASPALPAMLVADTPVQRESPHEVTVFRGSKSGGSVERVTFENKHSSQVIGSSKKFTGPPAPQPGAGSAQPVGPEGKVPPWARSSQPDEARSSEDEDFDVPRDE